MMPILGLHIDLNQLEDEGKAHTIIHHQWQQLSRLFSPFQSTLLWSVHYMIYGTFKKHINIDLRETKTKLGLNI